MSGRLFWKGIYILDDGKTVQMHLYKRGLIGKSKKYLREKQQDFSIISLWKFGGKKKKKN